MWIIAMLLIHRRKPLCLLVHHHVCTRQKNCDCSRCKEWVIWGWEKMIPTFIYLHNWNWSMNFQFQHILKATKTKTDSKQFNTARHYLSDRRENTIIIKCWLLNLKHPCKRTRDTKYNQLMPGDWALCLVCAFLPCRLKNHIKSFVFYLSIVHRTSYQSSIIRVSYLITPKSRY